MCHLTKYLREKGWKLNLSLQIDIEFPSDKTFTWVWVYKVISDDNIFFKGTIFILVWLLSIKVHWNFSLVTDNFWEFVFKLFGDITFWFKLIIKLIYPFNDYYLFYCFPKLSASALYVFSLKHVQEPFTADGGQKLGWWEW